MEIAVDNIRLMALNSKNFNICLSGGIDSYCMLQCFLKSGVKFKASTLVFDHGLNAPDVDPVLSWAKKFDFRLDLIKLDVIEFYESYQFLEYMRLGQMSFPELAAHLYLIREINGTPIFSGNPPIFLDSNIHLSFPSYEYHCYDRFFRRLGILGVGHFFIYSKELAEAFASLRLSKRITEGDAGIFLKKPYLQKVEMYRESGFDLYPSFKKANGFERLYKFYDEHFGESWFLKFAHICEKSLSHFNHNILKGPWNSH